MNSRAKSVTWLSWSKKWGHWNDWFIAAPDKPNHLQASLGKHSFIRILAPMLLVMIQTRLQRLRLRISRR